MLGYSSLRGDGDPGVVVDAEAARHPALGVVESAGEAQGVLDLAVHDEPASPHRRPGHAGARLVHAFEDGIVLGTEPVLFKLLEFVLLEVSLAPASLLHLVHVGHIVHGPQILVRRRLGLDERVPLQEP